MNSTNFFIRNLDIILFYIVMVTIIYFTRKKWDIQGKIVAMYRTKIGLKTMHWVGRKTEKFTKGLALVGVVVGYMGMAATIYMIIDGLLKLFVPGAPATFAPVLPGVKIPGVEFFVPFWYGMIALFVTIVIHEFSHGLVAEAYKLKVKNTGFVMFGPLPGAFVEPDEKQLTKASKKTQLSVYAAGPFSNILLTLLLIVFFGFLPIFGAAMTGNASDGLVAFSDKVSIINFYEIREDSSIWEGFTVTDVVENSAAEKAGLLPNTTITTLNGISVQDEEAFYAELQSFLELAPQDELLFEDEEGQEYAITVLPHTDNASKGQIGIYYEQKTSINPETIEKYGETGFVLLQMLYQQLFWIILLSSGVGLANLLPIGPVDGGRMYLVALQQFFKKKQAEKIWTKTSVVVFFCVIILLVIPILKNLLL